MRTKDAEFRDAFLSERKSVTSVCVLGGRGGGLNWLLQALTAILHMVFQIEFPFKAYLLVAPYTNAQNQIPPTT